mmetsp:Transcript_12654/g.18990  ORF Transcript_12654/g.18990 Transcript_12654/m.18990 type:complete len:334 (+) Transcript_12654:25-1026(+)
MEWNLKKLNEIFRFDILSVVITFLAYIGISIYYNEGIVGKIYHKFIRKTVEKKKTQKRVLGYSVITREKAYDGCKMYNPKGKLIAQISKKRYKWYLKKELATEIEPGKIKLKFEPKGDGNAGDKFYLSERKSVCVVCGSGRNYLKYHIVPYIYRKALPEKYRSHNSYDVVLMCPVCNKKYTKKVNERQRELAEIYKAPLNGINLPEVDVSIKHIKSIFYLLLKKKKQKRLFSLPQQRLKKLITELNDYAKAHQWGVTLNNEVDELNEMKPYIDKLVVKKITSEPFLSHGDLVIKALFEEEDAYPNFVYAWRKHFVKYTKPKYMNEHWDIHHPV